MYQDDTVAVVIPARNEEQAIRLVVSELFEQRNTGGQQLIDEIVVCDNGSSDATAEYAAAAGAKVVYEAEAGYGAACLRALAHTQADIIVFFDGDHAFKAEQTHALLAALQQGAQLVIGSRVLGGYEKGALTLPQRFGNHLACWLIQRLWGHQISDLGPFRAIKYHDLQRLNMSDRRYGWTVEMQVKAISQGYQVVDVPVDTRCRIGESKISGTLRGCIGAAMGILTMISRLWWRQFTRSLFSVIRP